jgi:Protein kinase domain
MRDIHQGSLQAEANTMDLDAIVERFEAAWQMGRAPQVVDFLPEFDGPQRRAVLVELAHVDLEYRIKSGQSAHVADYLRPFPTLVKLDGARGLLAWEQELRHRAAPGRMSCAGARVAQPEIPGYEILGTLGRGGMGIVYKARHIRLNRLCALKMILAGSLAAPERILRFMTEAEITARLRHPNIVQIYHFGTHADGPFLELEYVGERSLASRLDGTRWSPREAAGLVEQIARAIDEARR